MQTIIVKHRLQQVRIVHRTGGFFHFVFVPGVVEFGMEGLMSLLRKLVHALISFASHKFLEMIKDQMSFGDVVESSLPPGILEVVDTQKESRWINVFFAVGAVQSFEGNEDTHETLTLITFVCLFQHSLQSVDIFQELVNLIALESSPMVSLLMKAHLYGPIFGLRDLVCHFVVGMIEHTKADMEPWDAQEVKDFHFLISPD